MILDDDAIVLLLFKARNSIDFHTAKIKKSLKRHLDDFCLYLDNKKLYYRLDIR